MLMMRPGRFCSTIHRLAARVSRNVPRRFTASTRSHTIGSSSHTRPIAPVPAELRRMSRRPKRAIVSATARSQSPASLTSPATVASAARPSAAAVSSSRSGLWSKTATRAPAATQAAAAARPIPDAPPLTSATLPPKLQVMSAMACVYSSRARACQPGAPPSRALAFPAHRASGSLALRDQWRGRLRRGHASSESGVTRRLLPWVGLSILVGLVACARAPETLADELLHCSSGAHPLTELLREFDRLSGSSKTQAIAIIVRALDDPDPKVRDRALWLLGDLRYDRAAAKGAIPSLLAGLASGGMGEAGVLVGFAPYLGGNDVPVLMEALRNPKVKSNADLYRSEILGIIGKMGPEAATAVPALGERAP